MTATQQRAVMVRRFGDRSVSEMEAIFQNDFPADVIVCRDAEGSGPFLQPPTPRRTSLADPLPVIFPVSLRTNPLKAGLIQSGNVRERKALPATSRQSVPSPVVGRTHVAGNSPSTGCMAGLFFGF